MANKHISSIVKQILRQGVKPIDNSDKKYGNPYNFVYEHYEQERPLIRDAEGSIISGHFRACFDDIENPICNFNITALDVSKVKASEHTVIIDVITFKEDGQN